MGLELPRLTASSLLIVISSFFVRLLSVVTMPMLTRLLVPEAYGTAAMATTLSGLASATALAGADMSYLRASGAKEFISPEQVETFIWRFVVAAATSAALVSYSIASYASRGLDWPWYLSLLVAASTAASMMQTIAQARARLQARHTALAAATAVSGILATGGSLFAAYFFRDALPLVVSGLIGYVSMVVLLKPPPPRAFTRAATLSRAQRRDILAIGLPGTITALAYWVISSADRWFLGHLVDAHAVGLYSVGSSIGIMGMVVNSAIFTVWTPEAIRLGAAENRRLDQLALTSEQLFASMALVSLGVAGTGGDIIALLAAPAFHDAKIVVPVIAGAVCFHGAIHLANAVFLIEKQLHRTLIWWCAGAGLSGLLNYLLIPHAGILGAAYAFLITTFFIAIALTIVAQRLLPLPLNWVRVALVLFVTASAAIVLWPAWSGSPIQSLLLKIPVLALIAGAFALIYIASLRSMLSNAWTGIINRN